MKKSLLILTIILSISFVSFSDSSQREIFYSKIKTAFGYSEHKVQEIINKRNEDTLSIQNLQTEYASRMTVFKSKEEYKNYKQSEFVSSLPRIIKHLNENAQKSDELLRQIEILYEENYEDADFTSYLYVQNMYNEVDFEQFIENYDESLTTQCDNVLSEIMDCYYIKYFADKYAKADSKTFSNLNWESPIGQEVNRFYWAYYSVVILKLEAKTNERN